MPNQAVKPVRATAIRGRFIHLPTPPFPPAVSLADISTRAVVSVVVVDNIVSLLALN